MPTPYSILTVERRHPADENHFTAIQLTFIAARGDTRLPPPGVRCWRRNDEGRCFNVVRVAVESKLGLREFSGIPVCYGNYRVQNGYCQFDFLVGDVESLV